MFNVFIIILREGVEIAVVLTIIMLYLKQLGQTKETGKVWLGAVMVALISLLAALGIFFHIVEEANRRVSSQLRRST